MKTLRSYVKEHILTYTIAIVFMIIAIALDMMFPKVTELIVNEVIIGRDFSRFYLFLAAIIVIGIGRSVFGYFKEFIFDKNCITIGTEMRKDLFDHIQGLSLDYFDDTNTGELMARVKDDIDKIYNLVGMVAMRGMEVTLNAVLVLYFMFADFRRKRTSRGRPETYGAKEHNGDLTHHKQGGPIHLHTYTSHARVLFLLFCLCSQVSKKIRENNKGKPIEAATI